jgi:RNA-directed DNA polymerase
MQTKLHQWAVEDLDRRFDDLYNLVCHPDFLTVAWERVRGNKGARTAGVDRIVPAFLADEADVVAFLTNAREQLKVRTFTPLPVRERMIPKPGGGGKLRTLGIPSVEDRIAQTVAAMYLGPEVERVFHPDSYGYRPGRSALDAVGRCRERCWKSDWVVDLDIRAFFDSVDHALMLKAVARHTDQSWILLYVRRWLVGPLRQLDGALVVRDRGTPQGSSICRR